MTYTPTRVLAVAYTLTRNSMPKHTRPFSRLFCCRRFLRSIVSVYASSPHIRFWRRFPLRYIVIIPAYAIGLYELIVAFTCFKNFKDERQQQHAADDIRYRNPSPAPADILLPQSTYTPAQDGCESLPASCSSRQRKRESARQRALRAASIDFVPSLRSRPGIHAFRR